MGSKALATLRGNDKTTQKHWDGVWSRPPRARLPSGLNVAVWNLQRLLKDHVKAGARFLEIGCAPGKILAWVGQVLQAEVSGLDYSEHGLAFARQLFEALGIEGDLRCEDVFATTFRPGSFDVVYSAGVIEHFDDPREVVKRHVALLKPGGKALIVVPNYGGLYGYLQRQFDPGNLDIHNLTIMRPAALKELAPGDLVRIVRAYPAGRLSPWLVSFEKVWPRPIARGTAYSFNALGLVQPVDIAALCPMLVLELHR